LSILVVGSVALDSVSTPYGKADEVAGGSAVYFSIAASIFSNVRLVGIVGTDFPAEYMDLLRQRSIDLRGLEVADGETFRWRGYYGEDLNVAHTIDTKLNVFGQFRPKIPAEFADSEYVFLANIDPALQSEVLAQVERPAFSAMDTMNYWLDQRRDEVARVMGSVDGVIINEEELRQFAGIRNLSSAARAVLELGPKVVVVKKGEYGCALYGEDFYFGLPAFPTDGVTDPTGAGDSFAGGFIGYLAAHGAVDLEIMKRAAIFGGLLASFTVESFSIEKLAKVTIGDIQERFAQFIRYTNFDSSPLDITVGEPISSVEAAGTGAI
jgi:sugar/nucleoside kinase (ribokinase family)